MNANIGKINQNYVTRTLQVQKFNLIDIYIPEVLVSTCVFTGINYIYFPFRVAHTYMKIS